MGCLWLSLLKEQNIKWTIGSVKYQAQGLDSRTTDISPSSVTWFDVNGHRVSFILPNQSRNADAIGHAHCQVSEVKRCLVSRDDLDFLRIHWHDMTHKPLLHVYSAYVGIHTSLQRNGRISWGRVLTLCVEDNDAVLCGPSYARPAQSDSAAQRLHNSQVGHFPHWLLL